MASAFQLRDHFKEVEMACILAVVGALGLAVHIDSSKPSVLTTEKVALINKIEQRYPNNSRVRKIVEDQFNYGVEPLTFLADHNIDLRLSAEGLPSGALIRLFKDHWQINPFADLSEQSMAVQQATVYVQAQERDGLPFGVGESFSYARAALVPMGIVPVPTPKP